MSPLEARYRRLLAAYPRDHRARHEEEMIGVLLAGARFGRTRPYSIDAARCASTGGEPSVRSPRRPGVPGWRSPWRCGRS
ncbi:hypothetical protein [Nonomuraea sp. KM90]|uniref:hypothetical protein n=1 Tax=Nonomuraea sp. KM90 TaxID=3457428 RepID=UPI003FCC90F5